MRERLRVERALIEDIGLALGAAGLLALVGGALLYAVVPELQGWALALLAASLACFALFAVLARRLIGSFLTTRQGRYGLNTVIMILAFTAILVIINVISFNRHWRADVTATGEFTLSPQTVNVLKDLKEPVVAYAFFTPDNPGIGVAEEFLREYKVKSRSFDYQIVDPETDPARATQYQVDQDGLVVFVAGERAARTADLSEQAFTSTLLRAVGRNLKTVCFLSGHGERSILGTTELGLSVAAQALEQELFEVRDFGVSSSGGVPGTCAVLVVAGPDRDLEKSDDPAKDEGTILRSYLGSGGNGLFLLGPETPESWVRLLQEAGIELGGGAVVDQASFAQPDRATPVIQPDQYYSDHPVTRPLVERSLVTFFPLVTRVAPLPQGQQPPAVLIIPLLFTSQRSWLESDVANVGTATYDQQANDRRGPVSIAVAAEFPAGGPEGTGRLLVIGNAGFAGNRFITSLGNRDLFINSINWLSQQEELISIRPKLSATRLLIISQREWTWILYSSVGLLPLLVSLVGAWTWWRRR